METEDKYVLDIKSSFDDFGLNDFLLHTLKKQGYQHPTIIQSQFIPFALEGKDIICQSRTGSGKTLAYVIPILHDLFVTQLPMQCIRVVLLNPSRELCYQCKVVIEQLIKGHPNISLLNVAEENSLVHKGKLKNIPDIVVATPATLLQYLKRTGNVLDNVDCLVLDEVDMMIAYGYENDIKELTKKIPQESKKWLLSATISNEVEMLKQLMMKSAVKIQIEDENKTAVIEELVIQCERKEDKALNLYVMLKMGMIHGKVLIFVNSIQRCFFVKLFLDLFGMASVVLNSDLPRDIRNNIIEQFNNNDFNILIATDESTIQQVQPKKLIEMKEQQTMESEMKMENEDTTTENYSVARGIDFQDVSCVINFDCPVTLVSYIHRIGRTGRGLKQGTAITFVCKEDQEYMKQIKNDHEVKDFVIDKTVVGAFKTRVYDVQKSVTKNACNEARLKEYKREVGNDEELKKSVGKLHVKHTRSLIDTKNQRHLRDVPDYLIPQHLAQKLKGSLMRQNEYETVKIKSGRTDDRKKTNKKKNRNEKKPKKENKGGFVKRMSKGKK